MVMSACVVTRGKYDRALGVMSKYQADRLQAQADRDLAIAAMEGKLAETSGALAMTKEQAAKERAGLEATIAASKEELEQVRAQRALTEQRMQEWKKLTSKLAGMISAGKIKVTVREGRMLVDLPSSVLFASGSADTSCIVWEVHGAVSPWRPLGANLDEDQLDALWKHLQGSSAQNAYHAIAALARAPKQGLPFLKRKLKDYQPPDAKKINQLFKDLLDE